MESVQPLAVGARVIVARGALQGLLARVVAIWSHSLPPLKQSGSSPGPCTGAETVQIRPRNPRAHRSQDFNQSEKQRMYI